MKFEHNGQKRSWRFVCSDCGGEAYWPTRSGECPYKFCPWCGTRAGKAEKYIAMVRFEQPETLPYLVREIEIYCDSMEDAIKDMKERFDGVVILSIELTAIEWGPNDGQRSE